MVRIGELMLMSDQLSAEQLEQGLRAQVVWGGRLGTNLVDLGFVSLDLLSQALGRQHRMPVAREQHFRKADRELQTKLSVELAERYSVVPLLRCGAEQRLAVAAMGPIDAASLTILAEALGVVATELIVVVSAELRLRYQLERVYGIQRAARFLRSRGKFTATFPPPGLGFEDSDVGLTAPAAPADDDADEDPIVRELAAAPITESELVSFLDEIAPVPPEIEDDLAIPASAGDPEDRRSYVRTVAEETDTQALGRIALRRVATVTVRDWATFGEATRAIRRAPQRDRVADLALSALERFMPACEAAVILVVRGQTAIGWKGFSRLAQSLPEVGIPLDQPGLVPRAIATATAARGTSGELCAIDARLMAALGGTTQELCVVPVAISGQIMCLFAIVTSNDAGISSVEAVATALGAGFERLMRAASG